jgi:hypothetical protein
VLTKFGPLFTYKYRNKIPAHKAYHVLGFGMQRYLSPAEIVSSLYNDSFSPGWMHSKNEPETRTKRIFSLSGRLVQHYKWCFKKRPLNSESLHKFIQAICIVF